MKLLDVQLMGRVVAALLTLSCAPPAVADMPSEPESAVTLDTVVVTGSRSARDSRELPFAITRVDAESIASAGPQVQSQRVTAAGAGARGQ